MNKFRMKQPVYIIVMLALGAACGVFAAVINLINLIKNAEREHAAAHSAYTVSGARALFARAVRGRACISVIIR